jgi:hypothetical protein
MLLETPSEKESEFEVPRGLNLRHVLLDVLSELSGLDCFKALLFEAEGAAYIDGFRKEDVGS